MFYSDSVLSSGGGAANSHAFSDDENDNEPIDDKSSLQSVIAFQEHQQHLANDINNQTTNDQVSNHVKDDTVTMPQKKKVKSTHSLLSPHKSNIKINELIEKMQQQQNHHQASSGVMDIGKPDQVVVCLNKSRKSNKKENEQNNQPIVASSVTGSATNKVKRRRFSSKADSMSETLKTSLITDENAVDNIESVAAANNATKSDVISSNCQPNSNTAEVIEEHSSCSTLSQQDEEIKELLMKKNNGQMPQQPGATMNGFQIIDGSNSSAHSSQKKLDQELKQLLEKEKQTTADLFMQLMKAQEDQSLRTPSGAIGSSATFLTQNENSLLNELVNLNSSNGGVGSHFILSQPGNKSATPVFELLMSPLFNTIMPSNGTIINSKTSSTTTPPTNSSSPTTCIDPTSAGGLLATHNRKSPASFKKAAKHQSIRNIISSLNTGNTAVNSGHKTSNSNINTSLISALRFDSNSNGSLDDLNGVSLTNQSPIEPQAQNLINKLISISPTLAHALQQQQNNLKIGANNNQKSGTECDEEVKKEMGKANISKAEGSKEAELRQRGTTPTVNGTTSSSPPPPPPIVSTPAVVSGGHSSLTAPSPTKLLQFYPSYSPLSAPDLHRPIPIIQKTPVVIDSNQTQFRQNTPIVSQTQHQSHQSAHQMQQQTLLTTLRSNSINNNSPLMFNMTNGSVNNSLLSNNVIFKLNSTHISLNISVYLSYLPIIPT